MNWFGFVESALLPTIIIAEIIAIAMLYKNGKKKKNKHQIYIISALCICELNNALTVIAFYGLRYGRISKTIIGICFFYLICFCRLTYYSIMTLLAIDRFLVFYLSMRYLSKWPPKRLFNVLVLIHVISFLIYICFACLIVSNLIEWRHFASIMSIPFVIWDVIYVLLVAATYIYIFFVYKRHVKLVKEKLKSKNMRHFKLFTPTLVIFTFIIFMCIPDFINTFTQFGKIKGKRLVFSIVAVLYRISLLTDPIIYIYNSKLLRKKNFKNRNPIPDTFTTEVTQF